MSRHEPLRHIQSQRGRGEFLAAGAQGIRCTDIAGADLAEIALAGETCQKEPDKGDAANQIGADDRGQEDLPAIDDVLPVGYREC